MRGSMMLALGVVLVAAVLLGAWFNVNRTRRTARNRRQRRSSASAFAAGDSGSFGRWTDTMPHALESQGVPNSGAAQLDVRLR